MRTEVNGTSTDMTHVTLTELRANMARYLDQVEADRAELVVTRQNHEPVVVMALAELEGLRETLHLLSAPANAERLARSIAEADAGNSTERALIEP
jgi:antitoxin YefM